MWRFCGPGVPGWRRGQRHSGCRFGWRGKFRLCRGWPKGIVGQKEKFQSIIFENHPIDVEKLKDYLEGLFNSEEGSKALDKLRKGIKSFRKWLQRAVITTGDVKNAIQGLSSHPGS